MSLHFYSAEEDKRMSETAKPAASERLFPIVEIINFIALALDRVGVPAADARDVATLMAESDARGADAHGIFRLPQYVKQIQSGGVNPRPAIRAIHEKGGTALLDGDNGLGYLVMKQAAQMAVEKARANGIGWVGTRHSNHAGAAQLYVRMGAAADTIGMFFCVGK